MAAAKMVEQVQLAVVVAPAAVRPVTYVLSREVLMQPCSVVLLWAQEAVVAHGLVGKMVPMVVILLVQMELIAVHITHHTLAIRVLKPQVGLPEAVLLPAYSAQVVPHIRAVKAVAAAAAGMELVVLI